MWKYAVGTGLLLCIAIVTLVQVLYQSLVVRVCLILDIMPPGWTRLETNSWGISQFFSVRGTSVRFVQGVWELRLDGNLIRTSGDCDELIESGYLMEKGL